MGLSETLKAISAPVRREILDYLKSGPKSAGEISQQFDLAPATVSHHLSTLRKAGLIEEEKQKNFIYYSLNLTVFEEILTWIQSLGGKEDENNMQRVIGNIVILTPVIVGLVFYNQLPNRVAIHFNVEEQANGFMDRNLAIVVLPFIALVIYNLLFSFFKQITIPFLKEFMLWLIPIFSVVIQGLILTFALGDQIQVRLTVIWLVALIFLVIGNYLPKSIGLATKNHNEISKSVARKLGYLMVAMSLALLISLCFNPYTTIIILGVFVVLILSILLPNFRYLRK